MDILGMEGGFDMMADMLGGRTYLGAMGGYQAITGASLNIIGKSLGHKTVAATQIYARLNDNPVREAMENATNKMLEYRKIKE